MNRTAPSIRNKLSALKYHALGSRFGQTKSCNTPGCDCCNTISKQAEHMVNGVKVRTAPGTCESYNIVYLAECAICSMFYMGRTTSALRTRCNGHRSKYYEILRNKDLDLSKDDYSLGLHIHQVHNSVDRTDFNKIYKFSILENCNPSKLEVQEHKWIHRLNTLIPKGINTMNPFGIPIF